MDNMQKLWQQSNDRLAETMELNQAMQAEIKQMKVQKLLSSMTPVKVFTLGVGMLWVGVFGPIAVRLLIQLPHGGNAFFTLSLSLQVFLTAIALLIYVYQLVKIQQVNLANNIIETQEQLSGLKTSTLWAGRILFLQLPLWTTFYWNKTMLENGNIFLWIMQVVVTGTAICLSIWLFRNISFANKNKRWFRMVFTGAEWTPLLRSMDLLEEVKEFRKD